MTWSSDCFFVCCVCVCACVALCTCHLVCVWRLFVQTVSRPETRLDDAKPPAFDKLAHAREGRHYPAAPESSGHIPNGPACDAGDPTTPNGFLAPHDARTGSIRPGSRHRAPKRHCPVRARHGALSSPRFPLCDPGVAAVPWRRAARCSQLLRTRRRSVAIHSTWKAAVRTAVD